MSEWNFLRDKKPDNEIEGVLFEVSGGAFPKIQRIYRVIKSSNTKCLELITEDPTARCITKHPKLMSKWTSYNSATQWRYISDNEMMAFL